MNNNKIINIQNTFFIHDYETFGKNPALDRPAQFAGIRTDCHFNPLEKPKTFICCPPNDYLPDPEAILLTGIDPIHSLNTGFREYKFAKKIQKIFNVPKTCILGYNNINFDNEFSRNIFYRNFYDPYGWNWKQENSSLDLLHIIQASYTLRPEALKWPLNKKGKPSFKLQDITKNNNITHKKQHDALSDVYATLELVKLIKQTQPKLFNYLYHYRKKQKLKKLINLNTTHPLLYIPTQTYQKGYATWIIPLAWHPNNKNILIACDLNTNSKILWKIENELNYQNLISYYQDPQTILKIIYINKCPILMPIHSLRPQDISRLNINPQHCFNNLRKIKQYTSNKKNFKKIISTITSFYDNYHTISNIKFEKLHVDNQLYKRFFNQKDLHIINIIRNTQPENLSKIHTNFYDDRLQSLLFYYRARNFPHTLNQKEKKYWLQYRQKLFTPEKLIQYNQKLNDLLNVYKKNEKKTKLLYSLIKYLEYIHKTLTDKI